VTAVDTAALREYLLTEHVDVVETIRACAEAAAREETTDGGSDTSAVRRGTEARLRELGVWQRLPRVLAGCVAQAGRELSAPPVAAPPYVAATATGVVLRATLGEGRLVVSLDALSVERGDGGVVLRQRDVSDEGLVRVEWR
jgi:hypothetical protein